MPPVVRGFEGRTLRHVSKGPSTGDLVPAGTVAWRIAAKREDLRTIDDFPRDVSLVKERSYLA